MNYAVYTHESVDGQMVSRILAYKMTQVDGVSGFHLMTQDEAQALADTMTSHTLVKRVLPLEPDQAITAF